MTYDLLVLGSGVAGLSAAVRAARSGASVALLTKAALAQATTRYAQGGVAAALDEPDSPVLHLADTLKAGAELCDVDAVRVLVTEGPDRLRELIALGAAFDRAGDDVAAPLALAREGGHSLPRIVHAGGDATGAEIERALVAAVLATDVEVREGWFSADLLVEDGRCVGVRALDPNGVLHEVRARDTIVATGGAGQLFAVTTNPRESTGDGIAMALRAGVVVADLEFVQFHPTALHHPSMPRPLLSEALRGEGAVLRDERGEAFMASEHPMADLAPRDVVARAITARLVQRGLTHLWLDATQIDDFAKRFPTISAACREVGLDPSSQWLPVAPAAHYFCGGIAVDLDGASTLPGLWAVGEVACSGVHGANRLASNSLLDGLVFGPRCVEAIQSGRADALGTGNVAVKAAGNVHNSGVLRSLTEVPEARQAETSIRTQGMSVEMVEKLRASLAEEMTRHAGVMRSAASLRMADESITVIGDELAAGMTGDRGAQELRNLCTVAQALVLAALAREESRGTHWRTEFPEASPAWVGRFAIMGGRSQFVRLPTLDPEPAH